MSIKRYSPETEISSDAQQIEMVEYKDGIYVKYSDVIGLFDTLWANVDRLEVCVDILSSYDISAYHDGVQASLCKIKEIILDIDSHVDHFDYLEPDGCGVYPEDGWIS